MTGSPTSRSGRRLSCGLSRETIGCADSVPGTPGEPDSDAVTSHPSLPNLLEELRVALRLGSALGDDSLALQV